MYQFLFGREMKQFDVTEMRGGDKSWRKKIRSIFVFFGGGIDLAE